MNIIISEEISSNGCTATVKAFLKSLQLKGEYLYFHSIFVGLIAEKIGENLGLSKEDVHCLKISGFLHDIGKIAIRDSILRKPGELSSSEWEQIRLHPVLGYMALEDIPELQKYSEIILYHHENGNGSGYPYGLKYESIPFESLIIKVSDMYAAMVSERSYKPSFPKEQAIGICLKEVDFLDKQYRECIRYTLNCLTIERQKQKILAKNELHNYNYK
ncbi:MAG: HD domain-containing protein [Nitrospirae bacterium]|nr:HD domain-containing protein [Nitrospirota bacterium]